MDEGLAGARRTIADLEGIDFDELTDNAAFQKQYGEAVMVIINLLMGLCLQKLIPALCTGCGLVP